MNKNSFLKGVTWLTVGGILTKMLGGIYKILLTRILGGENIGKYQQVFPIYTFFVVLITAGVPLGISKLLSRQNNDEDKARLFKSLLKLFTLISTVLSIVLIFLGLRISKIQQNTGLTICYFILAPAIIFSGIVAVIKGYYQGIENFKPSAISQIVEQLAKVILGLTLSLVFAKIGIYAQIIGAVTGVAVGDFVSLLVMLVYLKKQRIKKSSAKLNTKEIKDFLKIVFPVMLSSLIIPFSQVIDSVLVVKLLNVNFNNDISTYLFGLQSGVVNAIINVPTVITFAICSVLLPSLNRSFLNKDEKGFSKKISIAIKVILIIAVPCALFVAIYPNEIINVLYSNNLSGYDINGEMLTSRLLFWSSLNVVLLSLSQFLSICLQAREHRYLPSLNSALGMVVKFVLEIIFIPLLPINILAFTFATTAGFLIIFSLNLYQILQEKIIKIEHKFWTKLFIVNTITILTSLVLMLISKSRINFIIVTIFSVAIYLFACYQIKILKTSEYKFVTKNLNKNKN